MSQSKEDPSASKNPKSSTPAKKPFPNFMREQKMVTVKIKGLEGTKKFLVHKDFACYHSPMLDKVFNGHFIESQTQSTEFDFDYPDSFGIIQNWMYRQKLESGDGKALLSTELYKVWILADYLLMPKLQNCVTAQIISLPSGFIPIASTEWIYKNTGPDSKLRHLFVNTMAWDIFLENIISMRDKGNTSEELLFDMIKVYKGGLLVCHQCRRGLDCGRKSCDFKGAQSRVNDKLDKEKYMVEENST